MRYETYYKDSDIFELDYLAFMVCKDLNDDFFDISIQRVFNIIPKVLNFWGSLDVDEIEHEIQEYFVEDYILDAINAGKYDEKISKLGQWRPMRLID